MNSFKLAVLDIAGTTVVDKDFVAIAFVEAFQDYGIYLSIEEINPLMGFKKTEAITKVLEIKELLPDDKKVNYIHNVFVSNMIKFYTNSLEVKPIKHAEEFFIFLKANNISVALDSGFPKVIVEIVLDRMQWLEKGMVDFYIASDQVSKGRPFPFMIEALMSKAGVVNSSEVIKIGDTMVDIQEGRMANCGMVAAVTTGAYTREELNEFSPDYIVDDLLDLEKYITR